jgi:tryptophan-rich sensory protein
VNTAIPTRAHDILGLVAWAVPVFVTALVGSIASLEAVSFYSDLRQPAWAPPAWLFGPVWTLLYVMIVVSGWLYWRRHGLGHNRLVMVLFGLQLAANALWSWLFFAWRLGGYAFVDIVLLASCIAAIIVLFLRDGSRAAAYLLLPYLAWVSFASVLNWWIWRENPGL